MTQQRRDLASIDQELAERAAQVREQVGQPESKKITVDRNGNFKGPGDLVFGNELTVCVVDFCSANDYYTASYDPNNARPPVCFARGRAIADMYPEDTAPEPQSENCASCPHNQFGSRGNGKACKNTRNLAVVLADELEGLKEGETPEMYLLPVPPTGLKSFDAFALQAARLYDGPPIKALVTIKVVQQGNYNTLQFTMPEPNPHYREVFPLMDAAEELIGRLPNLSKYEPTKKAGGRR